MRITLNGKEREIRAATVAALVSELKLEGRPVAIELNREVVPKVTFAERRLKEGDRIEIVDFVGGG